MEVCDLANLEELNCHCNILKCIPQAIIQLQSLVHLNLRYVHICRLLSNHHHSQISWLGSNTFKFWFHLPCHQCILTSQTNLFIWVPSIHILYIKSQYSILLYKMWILGTQMNLQRNIFIYHLIFVRIWYKTFYKVLENSYL